MQLILVITSQRSIGLVTKPGDFIPIMEDLKELVVSSLHQKIAPQILEGRNGFLDADLEFDLDIRILRHSIDRSVQSDLGAFASINPHIAVLKEKILPEFVQERFDLNPTEFRVNVTQFPLV